MRVDAAPGAAEIADAPGARLRRWQALTVALLVAGYSGYYLCRSNYSVALPLIVDDLAARGADAGEAKVRLGEINSLGTLAYASGKFFAGGLADALGGRRNFLAGIAGAVACTLAFAGGGSLPAFAAAWSGNRLTQSLGWAGMIKIVSRWFSPARYGTVMGFISLSYLFGDAAARASLGFLIGRGVGWRGVFVASAAGLAALGVLCVWKLKESPGRVGEPEPAGSGENVYGATAVDDGAPAPAALFGPLLASPAFWLVCGVSLGATLVRETFNTWTPTYFREVARLSPADAAGYSAVFPLLGGASVLLSGYLGDRLGRVGRAAILAGGLAAAAVLLIGMGLIRPDGLAGARWWPVALVAAVGFAVIGPYSFLAGAIALDFGGKRGGATASGLIDGVGYLAGVLAGGGVARLSLSYGWAAAFATLGGVAALSSVAAAAFLIDQARANPRTRAEGPQPR